MYSKFTFLGKRGFIKFIIKIKQIIKKSSANKRLSANTIQYWREMIFNGLILFFLAILFFAYIIALFSVINKHLYAIALLDTIAFLYLLIIGLIRKIPFNIRVFLFSFTLSIYGILLFLKFGPVVDALQWMFIFPILTGIFCGFTFSVVSLIINFAFLIVALFLFQFNLLKWDYVKNYELNIFILIIIDFTILNFISAISISALVKGFEKTLRKINKSRTAIVLGLSKLAEYRDNDTGKHLERIREYTNLLVNELSKRPQYKDYITMEYIDDMYISSILHDIGKVGISDDILLKPAKLTISEFEKIKQHPVIGANVINEIEKNIGDRTFLTLAKQISLHHHEKWDGSGYPDGLKDENIPLSARIVALVDVYDAMTTKRCYKDPISHEEAVGIIKNGKGINFDPDIVDVFLKLENQFQRVSLTLVN